MKTLINSDKTIAVDLSLKRFVKDETERILARFADRLTRVEVHLNDVNNLKTGKADKRCLVEARPAGAQPRTTSATATKLAAAIGQALRKMQSNLTSFYGRSSGKAQAKAKTRTAAFLGASVADLATVSKAAKKKTAPAAKKKSAPKKSAANEKEVKLSPRGPKKKHISLVRRQSWPKS